MSSTLGRAAGLVVRTVDALGWLGGQFANLGIWLLTAFVTYDVALRTLAEPTLWAGEVSVYLMLAIAFLGAGATQAVDGHFRVTFVRDMFPPRGRAVLDVISLLLALVFALIFTWGAYTLLSFSWMLDLRTSTILQVPLWIMQACMFVGGILLSLATLRDLIRVAREGSVVADEAEGIDVI
ncbi:TRAP transporter small permease subunit [Enterovirga rhinocerotis]|uniref:TRAP transporter small permease protein n=1 Tax=Enterovirga rhinocerotis TaxID=1339210 RepID=A0A4R7BWV0_9HYPH|nr:TRAP transporter small permease [Enterovirga rhinocerotis]TDR90364.1 TRAP-type C4-dicarboxylate transport system permease small subunit [Enterovirga rhinocerotis]